MSGFRVWQISDAHLSRERPFFQANWDAFAAYCRHERPDLVINSGDIALDGPGRQDDLPFAREQHDRLEVPVRFIPGNHDLGYNPAPGHDAKPPITEDYRTRYRRLFGDDWWSQDIESWRLIGINAQLLGSGLDAEAAQWGFLETALAAASGPLALFVHRPLYDRDPTAVDGPAYRYVIPGPRRRLLAMIGQHDVRVVASGHVHQHRLLVAEGISHVWAPSSAFILNDRLQTRLGTKIVGFVDYRFDGTGVTIALARAPGMVDFDIADFPQAYSWQPRRGR